MTGYWPFWAVAPALAAITVGYWIVLRRPLGVSGVLSRFSRPREEAEFDRGVAVLQADQAALEAAMAAMTAEAFGPPPGDPEAGAPGPAAAGGFDGNAALAVAPGTEWPAPPSAPEAAAPAPAALEPAAPQGRVCAPTPRLGVHLTFLLALAAGGLLTALVRGTFGAGYGPSFAALVGAGPGGLAALAVGGLLVGFGGSLCGGCTAGHGLTGCSRLMPGSLVATATFFAAAAGTSFLLAGRVP